MKIAIKGDIYDSEKTLVLLKLRPQERLDIIGMPPNESILILAPNSMQDKYITKWAKKAITKIQEKEKL